MYCASPSARTRLSRSALYLARSASGSKSITSSSAGGMLPSIRFPRRADRIAAARLERLTNLEHAPILLSTRSTHTRQLAARRLQHRSGGEGGGVAAGRPDQLHAHRQAGL